MAGYYVPSIKGGGPIQSIKNLVDNFSTKVDFYIVAADRDLGDDKPFRNIETNKWVKVGNANVYYTDISKLTWKKTISIFNSVEYDVIYLNSFFSYKSSTIPILLRKLKKISSKPIILAPRGQFSPGALGLKNKRKTIYLNVTKALRFYKGIIWHATAESEKKDIESVFGSEEKITVANNLTANYEELNFDKTLDKIKGELKLVFISRVHPKKNLKKAIEFLKEIEGIVEFNIFGPLEDKAYWFQCEKIIKELPTNIKVSYQGLLDHDDIIDVFREHHFFIFPTLGENFGHVISEALIGGCPVIISDQTPWRGLEEEGIGWDINLSAENKFVEVLQQCVNYNHSEYKNMSLKSFDYGKLKSNTDNKLNAYENLLSIPLPSNQDVES